MRQNYPQQQRQWVARTAGPQRGRQGLDAAAHDQQTSGQNVGVDCRYVRDEHSKPASHLRDFAEDLGVEPLHHNHYFFFHQLPQYSRFTFRGRETGNLELQRSTPGTRLRRFSHVVAQTPHFPCSPLLQARSSHFPAATAPQGPHLGGTRTAISTSHPTRHTAWAVVARDCTRVGNITCASFQAVRVGTHACDGDMEAPCAGALLEPPDTGVLVPRGLCTRDLCLENGRRTNGHEQNKETSGTASWHKKAKHLQTPPGDGSI